MYNYGAPGYSTRPPPGFSGPPPVMNGMAPPPGMAAPPGVGGVPPPGITPPPGVTHAQPPVMGAGRGLPPNWQAPPNMPNINFNAPVIHFGTSGPRSSFDIQGTRRESAAPGGRRGPGDGGVRDADQAQRAKDIQSLLAPPSREEIARTIFVSNVPDIWKGDEDMERILATAGNLRRWTRCTDAKGKPCSFGFAEYEDAESLETAAEIFQNVQVPAKKQWPGRDGTEATLFKKEENANGDVKMEDIDDIETKDGIKCVTLKFVVDSASKQYAEEWKKRRGDNEATTQFRIHTAQEALDGVLASLFHPKNLPAAEMGGDAVMHDTQADETVDHGEVVTIQITADDELSEIPEDMRETVAQEIAAFRDRANKRDLERLALEERIEAEEHNKTRPRLSPPSSAPSGPAGANGVPLGPRAERGVQGAPSGPRGSQFPSDYQAGVAFVNGSGVRWNSREDDDDSASDDALEATRQEQRRNELNREFRTKERYWLSREDKTVASLRRNDEAHRMKEQNRKRHKENMASRLRNWDDTLEAQRKSHQYYREHADWSRARADYLAQELQEDAIDRAQEEKELAVLRRQKEVARGRADAFLSEQAEELGDRLRTQTPREPQRFKLSLGAAAKKVEEAAASRRTGADIASLLDDEENADGPVQRKPLVPIQFDASIRANLTSEEIAEAQQQLAREIPNDKESLWKWNVSWKDLPEKNISKDIKDWAEKKIVESLGVQEDMLVDAIVEHVRQKKDPQALVEELSEFLEDDAEQLVRKLWRMVIYYSESEKRGIK